MKDDAPRPGDLPDFVDHVRSFSEQREWGQFHNPKNLVMALGAEVGELTALFQWLTPAQAQTFTREPERLAQVQDEMADVFIYLVRLSDVLGIDLLAVGAAKLARNQERYPVALARGSATKYNELER